MITEVRGSRAGWPSVLQAICTLAQASDLPAPVTVVRTGPGAAMVRLDSNADAVAWMGLLDPGAAFVSDEYGVVHVRCDWMGWSITISGAGDPSPSPASAPAPVRVGVRRGTPAHTATVPHRSHPSNHWADAA